MKMIWIAVGAAVLAACASVDPIGPNVPEKPSVVVEVPVCAPHKVLTATLFKKHRETLVASGTTIINQGQGAVSLFYASPNGTWTVVVAASNGMSCIAFWGRHWRLEKPPDDSGHKV
jgi:hypothetical protein